jgi:hypothetical protein
MKVPIEESDPPRYKVEENPDRPASFQISLSSPLSLFSKIRS